MTRSMGVVAVSLLMCIGLVACSESPTQQRPTAPQTEMSPDEQIRALPWPADGIYGINHDGYLGYLQNERKNIQVSFIQVVNQSKGRVLNPHQITFETTGGAILPTEGCKLLPGTETPSYKIFTLSCDLADVPVGLYRLAFVTFREGDRREERLPLGTTVLEILPGHLAPDIYVSRWHLQEHMADEYRALLVNDGDKHWEIAGFHETVLQQRLGNVTKLGWSNDYASSSVLFQDGPITLGAKSSVAIRVEFEHPSVTMFVLRPIVTVLDTVSGESRKLALQTTFYTPALSPRDVLAFTQNADHLRDVKEAITKGF